MKKVFGIIVRCGECHSDLLVPLQNLRLHLVQAELQDQSQLNLEMSVTDGGEGAESEEEIAQTATTQAVVSPQGAIPSLSQFALSDRYLIH